MPSLEIKPTSIALFPTASDRTTVTNVHQQYYLSPPLTPFPHIPSYNDNPEHTSPALQPYQPTLPALQEMLPHENRQRNSSTDQERFQQYSASQQHPERDRKEIIEHNSVTSYRSGQPMTDPARILPLYTAQPHNGVPQTSNVISPLLRRNKAHVASACVNCKKAHLACDGKFPHPFCPITSLDGRMFPPFSDIMATMSRLCGMHVKPRLRDIFGLFLFYSFIFLAFSFFSFCFLSFLRFVWFLNWEGGRGGGSGTGKGFFHRLHCAYVKVLG